MREIVKTKIFDLKGLFLLVGLCLIMLAQRKVTIVTWFMLSPLYLYCFLRWRQAILLVFLWLTVEGFLRLWIGGDIIVFFFKDAMFFAIYMGFLLENVFFREKMVFSNPVNAPILCLSVLSLIQMLNPNLHSGLVGLVGLKTLLFYIPLFYISYKLFDSKDTIYQFCFIMVVIAIPVCLYGLIQFLQGPSAYRGLGEKFVSWMATNSAFAPPSTFIFVSLFAGYLLFMVLLGVSMLNFSLKISHRVICWVSFISVLAALIVNSRRLIWAIIVAELPIMFLLQGKIKPFLKLITAPLLIVIISILLIPQAGDVFFGRQGYMLAHPIEVIYHEKIIGILSHHIPTMLSSAFIGMGIGMGSLGRRYVWSEGVHMLEMECQYAKIWYELSIWGFLIFVWFLVRLLKRSWRVYKEEDDPDLKWLALGIFMYQWAIVIAGTITNILDLPINSIYFWFFSGLLLKLPLLNRRITTQKKLI